MTEYLVEARAIIEGPDPDKDGRTPEEVGQKFEAVWKAFHKEAKRQGLVTSGGRCAVKARKRQGLFEGGKGDV